MTFSATTNAGALAKALQTAARVSPRSGGQGTVPILSNVKLSARDLHLVIEGTNLERRIEFAVEGKASGQITASAERLAAVTKELDPAGDVTLGLDASMLTLKQGRARFKLQTLPPEDFPPPTVVTQPVSMQVATPPLAAALTAVMGAIDPAEARHYLRGAAFDCTGRHPMLVATNGKIMSASPVPFIEAAKPPVVLIPIEAMGAIVDVCNLGELATLKISKASFGIEVGLVSFWTKVIDQEAIQWRRFIRKGSATTVGVNMSDLSRALRRTEAAGLRSIRLNLADVVRTSGESGPNDLPNAADDEFPAIEILGEPVTILLATRDLRWAIQSFKNVEALDLALNDKDNAMEFRARNGDYDDVRVVMPWRSAK